MTTDTEIKKAEPVLQAYRNQANSRSLRLLIPSLISKALAIDAGDLLSWRLERIDGETTLLLTKFRMSPELSTGFVAIDALTLEKPEEEGPK